MTNAIYSFYKCDQKHYKISSSSIVSHHDSHERLFERIFHRVRERKPLPFPVSRDISILEKFGEHEARPRSSQRLHRKKQENRRAHLYDPPSLPAIRSQLDT